MSVNTELRPIVQFLLDDLPRCFRHQAERIAGEINKRLSILARRKMKFVAKLAQRILGVELLREFFLGRKLHIRRLRRFRRFKRLTVIRTETSDDKICVNLRNLRTISLWRRSPPA